MNYTQIQQFLVLSKTMNMTKAAKELYITQPALSHALAKMEDELGLKLVYRDGNRLVLTEEGRKIQKDFEAIVHAYDDMNAHASMMREGRTEKITLGFAGAITAFSSLFTYGILSEFQGISIRKIFAEHEIIDNMLQNGQIDFAITFPPLTGKNIESRILVHDPIQLAVAGGHPLLKQFTIHLEDLADYPLLCLTDDNPFTAYCDDLLRQHNAPPMHFQKVSYHDLVSLVDQGRNAGQIASITTRKQFSSWFGRGYRCMHIADFDETMDSAICWRIDSYFAYEYKELVDYLEKGYDRVYYRNYRNMKPSSK